MSSALVRTKIKDFIKAKILDGTLAEPHLIDLTAQYGEIKEFLEQYQVPIDTGWLGIEFIGNDEVPVTLPASNTQGKYRETGAIYFHVVEIAQVGIGDSILTRAEALRKLMRGQRIDGIFVDSVSPVNFGAGATLQFEAGFISASFICSYTSDLDL